MPFKSKAQVRYLYSQHPGVAKEFASKTSDFKDLPQHLASAKKAARSTKKKMVL